MMRRQNTIAAVIAGLVFISIGYADMMPAPVLVVESQQTPRIRAPAGPAYTDWLNPLNDADLFDPFLLSGRFIPPSYSGIVREPETQPLLITSDGQSSLSLCLYALMGLGLCSAPHWIKRLSHGVIPEWYHDGGPFQIGHSFAATPESLRVTQVYCFLPTDETAEDSLRQCSQRVILSFWRKSQCTPVVLLARGPPLCS